LIKPALDVSTPFVWRFAAYGRRPKRWQLIRFLEDATQKKEIGRSQSVTA
jgi:hypothetical protein